METQTELEIILSGKGLGTNSGQIIENAPPVDTSTTANFLVQGRVTTAGGNNVINSLIFTPGSSLFINNTLYLTQGPTILVGGSSITLNGNLSVNELDMLFGSLLNGTGWIFGNLVNGGTVSPGDAPGTIRMSGNYTQTPTGLIPSRSADAAQPIQPAGREWHSHHSSPGTSNSSGSITTSCASAVG